MVLFSGAADDFCFNNVSRHLRRTYSPDSSFHKPLQTLRDGHGTKGKIEGPFLSCVQCEPFQVYYLLTWKSDQLTGRSVRSCHGAKFSDKYFITYTTLAFQLGKIHQYPALETS